jgi:hypothetical protein
MTVLETIRKLQHEDEGTARVLLELALYEAVCDEADRVRPQLDAEVAKALHRNAARGLVQLAQQPVSKASIALADQLVEIVEISKDDWDATEHPRSRDDGRFVPKSGKIRRGILNALGFATQNKDADMETKAHGALGSWAGPEANNYTRLRSLGQGLVATNDPNARPAGTVLRLIGDIGPEAQKHLEPGIRRTAYRYRGTERRPDPEMQKACAALVDQLQGPGQDQARLKMTSDFGVSQLVGQIPDRDAAAISLAAGKMPPSVGLMFDSRGRVVSEAMGFNGDHYLPFDLKNLKRLHGGSYVRTRTTGGLTDEDIYTGLMTGARHITVVSNSGVFTLEFDKDLRGGRRYSDKARQMVDRYARLVGAIGSGKLYQNKLPQEEVARLRASALKAAGNNAEKAGPLFRQKLQEAQSAAAFLGPDDDDLMAQAEAAVDKDPTKRAGAGYERAVKEEFNALRAKQFETTVRQYKLDGEGYKAALTSLKTEFPYFIRRTTYLPLQEYGQSRNLAGFGPDSPRRPRGGSDMGYTVRGGLDAQNRGVKDAEGKTRILGAPAKPKGHGAETTTPPAAGGGSGGGGTGTTPTPGGGGGSAVSGDLGEALGGAAKERTGDLSEALQLSLQARTGGVDSENWVDPFPDDDENVILGRSGQAWAKWAHDNHGKSWPQIAKWLATDAPVEHIDAALKAVDHVQTGIAHDDAAKARFTGFDKAKETLEAIRKLRKPFRDGEFSPTLEPEVGETDPQAHPDVLALGADKDKILEYATASGNEQKTGPGDFAGQWQEAGATDEQIRAQIVQAAARIRKLRDLADGKPVMGLDKDDPEVQAEASELASMGDDAPAAQAVANMHIGWSLLRLAQVVGSTQGTGAAVPFEQPAQEPGTPGPVAMRDSTASRLVLHSPDSPVAKAVQAALRPSPSLRRVRLPASR